MGGLYYQNQPVISLIGSKLTNNGTDAADPTFAITRSTLTAAYAGNVSKAAPTQGMSQVILNVSYVAGTNATALSLKIEGSADIAAVSGPVNWFQETGELVSAGTTTEYLQERSFTNAGSLVAATTYNFEIGLSSVRRFLRISAKETLSSGTAFGSIFVEACLGGK